MHAQFNTSSRIAANVCWLHHWCHERTHCAPYATVQLSFIALARHSRATFKRTQQLDRSDRKSQLNPVRNTTSARSTRRTKCWSVCVCVPSSVRVCAWLCVRGLSLTVRELSWRCHFSILACEKHFHSKNSDTQLKAAGCQNGVATSNTPPPPATPPIQAGQCIL